MNLGRRGFLGALAAGICAPAIIRTPGLLMPIKPNLVQMPDGVVLTALPHPERLTVRSDGACTFTIHGTDHNGAAVTEKITITNGMQQAKLMMRTVTSVHADNVFFDSNPSVTGSFSGEEYFIVTTPAPVMINRQSYLDVKNSKWGPASIAPNKTNTMFIGYDPVA